MTKTSEYAFKEMINYNDGFLIIAYDTLDDLARKVDMIETEKYLALKARLIGIVRKESISGAERHAPPPRQPQQPSPAQAAPPPAQQPQQQPAQGQGQQQPEPNIENIAAQYQTIEQYLIAIDFRISDKEHPHEVSYFRTEKSGNTKTAFLSVFKGKDGAWGMSKWLIIEKKQIKYELSWGYPYSEIIGVVDAIDGQSKIQGR